MKLKLIISWLLRILAALIMLQTLYFKFSGAPESIYIFSTLGMEPWGRIGSGIAELAASILLLWPRTISIGAIMGTGVMAGALVAHLGKLGIEVQGDGGYLFILCLIVMTCCVTLLVLYKKQLLSFILIITGKKHTAAAANV